MTTDKLEKHEFTYLNEDKPATQKDLKILSLELEHKMLNMKIELENKINSMAIRLGAVVIASSGILFSLLSYFHR